MKLSEVYAIWDRFDGSDLTELHLETAEMNLTLSRRQGQPFPGPEAADRRKPAAGRKMEKAAEVIRSEPAERTETGTPVKAPLVGIFYRASAPDAEPYVTLGQEIHRGDVIGIVEAMKMMNEVTAPQDGKVLSIEAEDGDLVEYGQVLIRIGG